MEARRQQPGLDAAMDGRHHAPLHVGHERELLVLAADARDAAIEKDQGEILRVGAAEFVEAPDGARQILERIVARRCGEVGRAEQAEALLRQREEDVVLRRKVTVDRAGAVLDLGRDVPDRDLRVSIGDK
jgi:hypothetical protein